jgi:ABC-2 type transport system ATP-binding protein
VLSLFARFYDDPRSPEELVDTVGLQDATRTFVRRLSGGQRQRLSLACALIGKPDVVFLDEPTAGMDPQARATTWELVRGLRDAGTTVVLTTHLLDEAEELCDRVAIITNGRLAAIGSPRELTSRARTEEVVFTASPGLDTSALAAALGLDPAAVVVRRDGEYEVRAAGTPALVAAITAHLRDTDTTIGTLQANARSLEAVFLQITAESGS